MATTPRLLAAFLFGLGLATVACFVEALGRGFAMEHLGAALRLTGRMTLLSFGVAYMASALHTLWPSPFSKFLYRWRPLVGVTYAGIQVCHLALIVTLYTRFEVPLALFVLVFGGGGHALTLAMLVTSFPGPKRRLGKRAWGLLHRVGMHWLAAIFIYDFWGKPFGQPSWVPYVPYAGFLLLVVALRIAAWCKRRAKGSADGA